MKFFNTVIGMMLLVTGSIQAQVYDEIKEAVHQNALKKTKSKVVTKTANRKAGNKGMGYGKNKVDFSQVPEGYDFSWKYIMKVTTDKASGVVVDYFLEPDAEYVGVFNRQTGSDMFMIMDKKNKITVTTFGEATHTMAMASKMPDCDTAATRLDSKFSYRTLDDKVILGYHCKGVEAFNAVYSMKLYYTTEAKVTFPGFFYMQRSNSLMADFFKAYFKPTEKPLFLQMESKDLKNGETVTVMECIALDKETKSFKKSDYTFM